MYFANLLILSLLVMTSLQAPDINQGPKPPPAGTPIPPPTKPEPDEGCSKEEINYACSCPRSIGPVCAGGIIYDNHCIYLCDKKEAECRGEQGFPELDETGISCWGPEETVDYVWVEREKIYTDEQCRNIGNHLGLGISDCKKKCDDTPTCSAINVRTNTGWLSKWIDGVSLDCILRACSFSVLQNPDFKMRDFKSYFKKFNGCSETEMENVCECTRIWEPVCAGDITYGNRCRYDCAKKEDQCVGLQGFPKVTKKDEC